jgi:catechol 2,3-dioxygenase
MTAYQDAGSMTIGRVHLRVTDLARSLDFYGDLLGLRRAPAEASPAGTALLSPSGEAPFILALTEQVDAQPKPPRSVGLYHVAIRLPDRAALARVFRRLVMHNSPFHGFSDHGVSEALYLADPDGNGLELYRDRPRESWPMAGAQVNMVTKPLDVELLLSEAQADAEPWNGIATGTDIGHVHLHISDLGQAEWFYVELLGMGVMQRNYPGALFVADGGYHHHIGLNTWAGRAQPPENAVGLQSFRVNIPGRAKWETVVSRMHRADVDVVTVGDHIARVQDADHNAVELALVAE